MSLLHDLQALKARVTDRDLDDIAARKQLLETAKDLVVALERPDDVVERVCFQLTETACIKAAVEMGIFKQLASASGSLSSEEIARKIPADPVMIARIMRFLGAWGAVKEVEGGYQLATVSQTFADPRNEAAIETCFDMLGPNWLKIPTLLRDLKYQNPSHGRETAIHKVTGSGPEKSTMELWLASPHLPAFGRYMSTFTLGHLDWKTLYPVKQRLIDGFGDDPDRALFVDVGGGHGHQVNGVRQAFPKAPGRFIVQDLAPARGPELPGIQFMAHDFNKPQPVKGARCYYLRFIMHDYATEINIRILRNLHDAMEPGYSRLIVNEWIIPERGASRFMTAEDLNMLSVAGMERTERQHREQLEAAGLVVTNVYRADDGISESVIEAMRPSVHSSL